jgi:hypothetical protein
MTSADDPAAPRAARSSSVALTDRRRPPALHGGCPDWRQSCAAGLAPDRLHGQEVYGRILSGFFGDRRLQIATEPPSAALLFGLSQAHDINGEIARLVLRKFRVRHVLPISQRKMDRQQKFPHRWLRWPPACWPGSLDSELACLKSAAPVGPPQRYGRRCRSQAQADAR